MKKPALHGKQSPLTGKEKEQGDRYRVLFEHAKDAIMVTDYEGNFMDVNSGLCSMFGYSKEELLQMNVCSLVDKQHLDEKPIRFDLLKQGENMLNERKMVHKNGSIIYVEANAKKLLDHGILAIARDITERKKIEEELQESEANLHTIFDTTETIYLLMDIALHILSYNPKAADFAKKELGCNIDTGKFFLDYFPQHKRPFLVNCMTEALAGRFIQYETTYRQQDGTVNWYCVRIFPISRNEKVFGLMMEVSNITEKKRLEKKLLEHEVQEQKKIIRAVLKAQEIERNRIGQELHDNINQILSSIRLYLDMIHSYSVPDKDLVKKTIDYVDLAINEIRCLSKEQVTPQQKFNLRELIQDLIDNLNEDIKSKTKFHCNVADHFPVDEDLKLNIYRIVQEQTNNILKYANASNATISILAENGFVHVCIIDDGKGFNPLLKTNGIGISNMINRIQSYNGQLEVHSSPGNGCKIEMTIPMSN
jgi:PAS domain S-box-containing protein